jgi:ABC-type bacteriocin/lantibiotic exporter with double-glycine peptidase domain
MREAKGYGLCVSVRVLSAAFAKSLRMYACATTFMTSAVTCAILYVGSSLVSDGTLSTGILVSFLLYQYNLTGALSSIADIWSGMQEAVGSARKIFSILDREPALRNV